MASQSTNFERRQGKGVALSSRCVKSSGPSERTIRRMVNRSRVPTLMKKLCPEEPDKVGPAEVGPAEWFDMHVDGEGEVLLEQQNELDIGSSSDASSDAEVSISSNGSLLEDANEVRDIVEVPLPPPADLPLEAQLRKWAVECNIANSSLSRLLKMLKVVDNSLPKDARTLLKIKPVVLEHFSHGLYYNFGVETVLRRILKYAPELDFIDVIAATDGLPIFKSSATQTWPLFIKVQGVPLPPLMTSVWCGKGKPVVGEFFRDFVREMKGLMANGLEFRGKTYPVRLLMMCCDAPARSFAKGIVSHTGYYGCERCTQKGEYIGRTIFPLRNAPLRTDESVRDQLQWQHHKELSPLLELGIGMVTAFPLDYQHLICLGVVRKMLYWTTKGKKNVMQTAITADQKERINGRLLAASRNWPRCFARKPRPLQELPYYKAVECRSFILYLAPYVLQGQVPEPMYTLYLRLHVALRILCSDDQSEELTAIAERQLRLFVAEVPQTFKRAFLSYNVHSVVHLADDCRRWGKLDNFATFCFENELAVVKGAIRGKSLPLQQLVGRYTERARELLLEPRVRHPAEGVLAGSRKAGTDYFTKAYWRGRYISLLPGNNAVQLDNDNVVLVKRFESGEDGDYIVGKRFMKYSNMYSLDNGAITSHHLSITVAERLHMRLTRWPLGRVKCKVVCIPRSDGKYAVFPLIQ